MDLCPVEHSGNSIYHLKNLITILNVSNPWIPTSMLIVLYLYSIRVIRVATVRGKILEYGNFFQVREFHFQSGKFRKNEKIMEKSGNFNFFPKKNC